MAYFLIHFGLPVSYFIPSDPLLPLYFLHMDIHLVFRHTRAIRMGFLLQLCAHIHSTSFAVVFVFFVSRPFFRCLDPRRTRSLSN